MPRSSPLLARFRLNVGPAHGSCCGFPRLPYASAVDKVRTGSDTKRRIGETSISMDRQGPLHELARFMNTDTTTTAPGYHSSGKGRLGWAPAYIFGVKRDGFPRHCRPEDAGVRPFAERRLEKYAPKAHEKKSTPPNHYNEGVRDNRTNGRRTTKAAMALDASPPFNTELSYLQPVEAREQPRTGQITNDSVAGSIGAIRPAAGETPACALHLGGWAGRRAAHNQGPSHASIAIEPRLMPKPTRPGWRMGGAKA